MTMLANVHEDRYAIVQDDPNLVEQVRGLAGDGISDTRIANALELTGRQLRELRRRNGIAPGVAARGGADFSDERFAADIRVLAGTGLNDLAIAVRLNISSRQVELIRRGRNILPGQSAGPGAIQIHKPDVARLVTEGMSHIDVASALGLTVTQVQSLDETYVAPAPAMLLRRVPQRFAPRPVRKLALSEGQIRALRALAASGRSRRDARDRFHLSPSEFDSACRTYGIEFQVSDEVQAARIAALAKVGCTVWVIADRLDIPIERVRRLRARWAALAGVGTGV